MPQDEEPPEIIPSGNDEDPESVPAEENADDPRELISMAVGELTLEEEFRRRELLDKAVGYAQLGWRVIPLCWTHDGKTCGHSGHNRGSARCASPGKRAILDDWPNRATNDPVRAGHWWRRVEPNSFETEEWYPFASIGVVLGQGSGIFALDIDRDHGGFDKLDELERDYGPLPPTRVHGTGGQGNHYLFAWPGFRVHNLKPWGREVGVDIKGDNGYIVMPPSRSHKGDYTVSAAMENMPIASAPEWLLEKLRTEKALQRGEKLKSADALPNRLIAKYVEAAKKGEHWQLSECPKGARNDQLFKSAAALGSLGAHGFLSMDEALALLQDAGYKNRLIQDDGMSSFSASFRSGWYTGTHNPRDLSGIGNLADNPWRRFSWDEFGLGARLVEYFGEKLRWVDKWQAWMSYDTGIWSRQTASEPERLAQAMIDLLPDFEAQFYDEETTGDEPSPRDKFLAWLGKQRSQAKKVSAAKIARDHTVIRAEPKEFDEKPDLLNCANGVIDLRTGKLSSHDPDLMLTMGCTVPYDPAATCPQWLKFLSQVQKDPEMQAYLQRVAGYSITGAIKEQVFFLHHGSGANGKSVFHDVISRVIGAYAQTVPVETLMDSSMDRIPNDVARMVGRRYLQASETKSGKFLDEPKLKMLTGGDTVSARFMRGEFFEFKPVGKVHLTTNHLPRLTDDSATWRRIHLITWPEVIPEHERDGGLADRLYKDEGTGILAWLIAGAMEWQKTGLRPPKAAVLAKEDYKRTEDEHLQWLEEECDVNMDRTALTAGSSSKVLWAHNRQWRQENGYLPIQQRAFTEIWKKKGYAYHNSGGFRGFPQIVIKAAVASR